MKALDRAAEWLRPFVYSKSWDYCVVWKLGNDPSRFIEWMDCCCSGWVCDSDLGGVKEEKNFGVNLCRDLCYKHPIRTKACEALARLPSILALYSGNHGEVVISNQPRWIRHGNGNALGTNFSPESHGTQVLIPVLGGLIELFSAKQVARDEKIIEFVKAYCNVPVKEEAMFTHDFYYESLNEHPRVYPSLQEKLHISDPPPRHLINFIPQIQVHEGSSIDSNPSSDFQSLGSFSGQLEHSVGKSSGQQAAKVIHRSEREHYQSKNLHAERNRRRRIKDGLHALRAIVPKISKMDKAAILGDAIEYIGELEKEAKKLQDSLDENEDDECKKHNEGCILPPAYKDQGSSCPEEKKKTEVSDQAQLQMYQIGKRDFLIKFLCEQKPGGFGRLMHRLDSLGFQVVDANITTFEGKVLNILKVEANKKDAQAKELKEALIELTMQTTVSKK